MDDVLVMGDDLQGNEWMKTSFNTPCKLRVMLDLPECHLAFSATLPRDDSGRHRMIFFFFIRVPIKFT